MAHGRSGHRPPRGDHAGRKRRREMTEETRTYPSELPLVPLREMVVFPKIVQPLGVGREKSVAAINAAMGEEKHYVIFAAQKDAEVDDVTSDQIYGVATVAEIVRLLRIPDGSAQVIVQGLHPLKITAFVPDNPPFPVTFHPITPIPC